MDLIARGLFAPCLAVPVEVWVEAAWEIPGAILTGSIFPAQSRGPWSRVDLSAG